ncbi:MAG: isochorismatase family protein [Chloroflexi bacterium]|nr:MAG: isochorismatase family protein [Chloroflexota bacterium]
MEKNQNTAFVIVDAQRGFMPASEACLSPEDDTSYTGALAYDPTTGLLLPDWLRQNNRDTTYVAGVALGDGDEHMLCVDSTAIDLHRQGFNVTLVSDATEAVMPANRELCLRNLAARGISIVTTEQAIAAVRGK